MANLPIHRASVSFSFEGMRNSFSCFASASTSEFREAGFLDAKLQGSCFNVVALRLCLRLLAGSGKQDSSAQDCREVNSRSSLVCVCVYKRVRRSRIPRRKPAKKRIQRSYFAPSSSSRFKEDGFLGAKLQRSEFKGATLHLRLLADSRKWDSSMQDCREANSRSSLVCVCVYKRIRRSRIPRRKPAKKQVQGSNFVP
ncbi:hypothetical protein GHH_c02680 [Geobacillus sp. GHH01]|nr:hypothetical protein GHH_c02680 [Geobacillus sp. GHH01]